MSTNNITIKSIAFTTTVSLRFIEELCRVKNIDLIFVKGYGDKIIPYTNISLYSHFGHYIENPESYQTQLVNSVKQLIKILEYKLEIDVEREPITFSLEEDKNNSKPKFIYSSIPLKAPYHKI